MTRTMTTSRGSLDAITIDGAPHYQLSTALNLIAAAGRRADTVPAAVQVSPGRWYLPESAVAALAAEPTRRQEVAKVRRSLTFTDGASAQVALPTEGDQAPWVATLGEVATLSEDHPRLVPVVVEGPTVLQMVAGLANAFKQDSARVSLTWTAGRSEWTARLTHFDLPNQIAVSHARARAAVADLLEIVLEQRLTVDEGQRLTALREEWRKHAL